MSQPIPTAPASPRRIEHAFEVDGRTRRVVTIVPDGVPASGTGIVVLPPSGGTIDELLESEAWWKACQGDADLGREPFVLIVGEPATRWVLPWSVVPGAEASARTEIEYLRHVIAIVEDRRAFCVHESKRYLVGYGDGGAIAKLAALEDPARFAGLAAVDAPPVPARHARDISSEHCVNLHGYDNDGSVPLRKGDVGLPVWLIGSRARAVDEAETDLWRARNGCTADTGAERVDEETVEYVRRSRPRFPRDEDAAAHRVRVSHRKQPSRPDDLEHVHELVHGFLRRQQRWMSRPGGDLRVAVDPVHDLGMVRRDEEIAGLRREWYVHVPASVRTSAAPAPVVVALHGYTCTAEIYIGNSGWHRVADEFGFIVVFPTALPGNIDMCNEAIQPDFMPLPAWSIARRTPGAVDDVGFIDEILRRTAQDWSVDAERVYATGHSWGSVMTQVLGVRMPDRLAAIAPCSGVLFGGTLESIAQQATEPTAPLPIWMLWGDQEPWLIAPEPLPGTEAADTIAFWAQRNGLAATGAAHSATTAVGRPGEHLIEEGGWKDVSPDPCRRGLVRATVVQGLPHATNPEMSRRIWMEFFARAAFIDRPHHPPGTPGESRSPSLQSS